MHFLIVDDDQTFCRILQRALQRQQFQVTVASSIAEALLTDQPVDNAVVDLNLAGESGLNLIPELKGRWPNCSVLILTGYSSIATAVEAVKRGAVNYLCKPATVAEILTALQTTPPASNAIPVPEGPPSIERLEWEHIQRVLQENNHNISATARALGMHRRTLQRKLQKRPVRA